MYLIFGKTTDDSKDALCHGNTMTANATNSETTPLVKIAQFRLLSSFGAEHKWKLGQMDIYTAFLQAKGLVHDVFV